MNNEPPDPPETETGEPVKRLLDHWSERLEQVRGESENETGDGSRGKPPRSASPSSLSHPEPVVDEVEEKQLPPLESLTPESDYSPFFSENVSESVRKLALRKLFASPVFNVSDGLDDYDEDFKTFTALGDLITEEMKFRERTRTHRDPGEDDEHSGEDGTIGENPGSYPHVAESKTEEHEVDAVEKTVSGGNEKPAREPPSLKPIEENPEEDPETASFRKPPNNSV